MTRARWALATGGLVAAVCLGGLAAAQTIPRLGYLGEAAANTLELLGPAPAPGSPRAEADRAIFRATRAMKGSPRWAMALADFDERAVVSNMSCAAGVKMDLAAMPATTRLIVHMAPDIIRAVEAPKRASARPRPYRLDPGETCAALPASEDNFDYPSGHSAWGWAVGLVLAELLPERADSILVRARAVGEGRVICGVHNYSSIVAGQTVAAAIVAAEHGKPEFQADLAAAKVELQAAAKAAPFTEGCDAEAKMLATPAW
ncbi:MAG TPA: phosphatase PAP2 family protein, partial [Caulobacter sp.]|nr:phosphatase PAP2 family protein [Caulobacter sp.]